jgi:homocysteine S-methyltransferase
MSPAQLQLDGAEVLQANDTTEWGNLMIELNRKFGVKILGGCCGTSYEHLQYIAQNVYSEQRPAAGHQTTRRIFKSIIL